MSHWNYRVIEQEDDGVVSHSIHEVYYHDDQTINGYVEVPVTLETFASEDATASLEFIIKCCSGALSKPILICKEGELL